MQATVKPQHRVVETKLSCVDQRVRWQLHKHTSPIRSCLVKHVLLPTSKDCLRVYIGMAKLPATTTKQQCTNGTTRISCVTSARCKTQTDAHAVDVLAHNYLSRTHYDRLYHCTVFTTTHQQRPVLVLCCCKTRKLQYAQAQHHVTTQHTLLLMSRHSSVRLKPRCFIPKLKTPNLKCVTAL